MRRVALTRGGVGVSPRRRAWACRARWRGLRGWRTSTTTLQDRRTEYCEGWKKTTPANSCQDAFSAFARPSPTHPSPLALTPYKHGAETTRKRPETSAAVEGLRYSAGAMNPSRKLTRRRRHRAKKERRGKPASMRASYPWGAHMSAVG